MTNEEIVRDYNAAKNKSKQIKVLADLNCVTPGEIRKVLAEAGVAGVKMPERIVKRKPETVTPEASAPGIAAVADQTVYERIEAILAALPEDAPDCVRSTAGNLVIALFQDYVGKRLGKPEGRKP